MNLAVPEIGISVLVLLASTAPALMIWALVDLLRRPTGQWENSADSRLMWVILIVFVGIIGPVLYFTIGRRQIDGVGPPAAQHG